MSDEIKKTIVRLLLSTERQGTHNLIEYMESNDFFKAPCSTQYHLAKEGGLAEHSLNVQWAMLDMAVGLEYVQPFNVTDIDDYPEKAKSIILVSLLHDLGKMGQFEKPNYIPNLISDRKGGYIQSEKKPFTTNSKLLAVPHEIRSIQIASHFIELTEEENFAILYHNGLYGDLKYQLNGKERPLQMLLHWADMWASRVIEKE